MPERSARGIVGKHDVVDDSETLRGPICVQDSFHGSVFSFLFLFGGATMNSNTLPMALRKMCERTA